MKLTVKQSSLFTLILGVAFFLSSCKKDQLKIDQEKTFLEVDFKVDPTMPYTGGWRVTLNPDEKATVLPGGDIVWNGTYKISGKNLTIKTTEQTFKFDILSETEIREKEYGVLLKLKK